jgi:hypothetical protein
MGAAVSLTPLPRRPWTTHKLRQVHSSGGDLQLTVPELIREVSGYRRVSRVPYWLRRGYVAELYAIVGK